MPRLNRKRAMDAVNEELMRETDYPAADKDYNNPFYGKGSEFDPTKMGTLIGPRVARAVTALVDMHVAPKFLPPRHDMRSILDEDVKKDLEDDMDVNQPTPPVQKKTKTYPKGAQSPASVNPEPKKKAFQSPLQQQREKNLNSWQKDDPDHKRCPKCKGDGVQVSLRKRDYSQCSQCSGTGWKYAPKKTAATWGSTSVDKLKGGDVIIGRDRKVGTIASLVPSGAGRFVWITLDNGLRTRYSVGEGVNVQREDTPKQAAEAQLTPDQEAIWQHAFDYYKDDQGRSSRRATELAEEEVIEHWPELKQASVWLPSGGLTHTASVEQQLAKITELIEDAKRELQRNTTGNREAIRAGIKRLEARYAEVRKDAQKQAARRPKTPPSVPVQEQMKRSDEVCSLCKEHHIEEGYCKGCKDPISTHCDANNSAVQCQECGDWFGNCCCMNADPRGNRCNTCFAKWAENERAGRARFDAM
jgi:hypothetical protein